MGLWYFTFLALFSLFATQNTISINETELPLALADMRAASYNGFVILLQLLHDDYTSFPNEEITFLMPADTDLSSSILTVSHLRESLLSHSIPISLPLNNLIHLPTGTVLPSSFQNKTFMITNHGRVNFFLNNVRIVKPNVCSGFTIKCHGVANVIQFETMNTAAAHEQVDITAIRKMLKSSTPSHDLLSAAPPLQ